MGGIIWAGVMDGMGWGCMREFEFVICDLWLSFELLVYLGDVMGRRGRKAHLVGYLGIGKRRLSRRKEVVDENWIGCDWGRGDVLIVFYYSRGSSRRSISCH